MSEWEQSVDNHRSRQRQRITNAAGEIMADGGISSLNMRALAEASGMSRPTLYKYFSNIDDVLVALFGEQARLSEQTWAGQLAGVEGAEAKLRLVVQGALQVDGQGHEASLLHWALSAVAREELRGHIDRITTMIAEVLSEGVDEGVFRADLDTEVDARLIRGALNALHEALAAGDDPARLTTIAERTILAAVTKL